MYCYLTGGASLAVVRMADAPRLFKCVGQALTAVECPLPLALSPAIQHFSPVLPSKSDLPQG